MRILIVDDNKDYIFLERSIIKRILPNAEIIEALDGKSAIAMMETHKPDIILLDCKLPDISGDEVARELRRRGYTKQIIAVTAHAFMEEKRQISQWANKVLTKPFHMEQLAKTIGDGR